MPKMVNFLDENHRGSPTLTSLNVLDVLDVLNMLSVLNMPKDASLACWALFYNATYKKWKKDSDVGRRCVRAGQYAKTHS